MERVEQIESENKQLKKQIAEILKRYVFAKPLVGQEYFYLINV